MPLPGKTRPVLAMVLLAGFAAAQPASDLLQSGILSQDTFGDVDGAIRIYRQILNGGPGMRLYAAQAQYRLGTCLLRKGDSAGATRAFEAVIKNYPEDRELVARARESMPRPGGLLPPPWGASELSEYRWTIPGVDDGWSITRIGPSVKGERMLSIRMTFYAPQMNVTTVEVDRETMRPVSAMYRGPNFRNARTIEGAGIVHQASLAKAGEFALGELFYLLRRMPLADGWSTTISVESSPGAPFSTALQAAVIGNEGVTVPAGRFQCYKVRLTAVAELPAPKVSTLGKDWVRNGVETLWFAADGSRPLVKIESGTALGELTGLRTGEATGTTSYRDSRVGYSFTLPPGWDYHARKSMDGAGSSADLIDPENLTTVVIAGKSAKTDPDRIEKALKDGAAELAARTENATTRSYALHRLAGHQALTWIQDQTGQPRVAYSTWVQSENSRVSIRFTIDAAEFEAFLRRLQPILDSFRMP